MAPEAPPGRILVLGHRLRGSVPSPVFAVRLRRALVLARSCPRADLVVLGGRSAPGAPSEAEAGRDWLVAHGLDPVRIGMETHSRHTLENLRNHRTTGPASGPEALVTSRLHLHRTLLMARGLGLAVAPVAAEDAFRPDLPALLTEGLMVHWYVTGRLLARLLRRRRWLARIA
nr:YdcF family protein [Neoroseomonas soli]